MKTLTRKNNPLGFSLIEILISIAILSTISLGVAYNIASLYKSQDKVADSSETRNFSNSLADYLGSNEFCKNELLGTPAPQDVERDLVISGLGGAMPGANDIRAGQEIIPGIRINKISIKKKTSVTTQQVFDGTNNLDLIAARITINMQNSDSLNPGEWLDLRPQTIDIPLLVLNNRIESCGISSADPTLTCAAIGKSWDESTGSCRPKSSCNIRGSFIKWFCDPNPDGYNECGKGSGLGSGGDGIPNAVTGGLNCPSGATPEPSGEVSYTYQIDCGKKCTLTINETVKFYICMECS